MTRQLFEGWATALPRSLGGRRSSWSVSVGLHAAGVAVLLAVPLFTKLDLPEFVALPPAEPRVFYRPPAAHTAPVPRPAAAARAAQRVPAAMRVTGPVRATQAAPTAVPDVLPSPEDVVGPGALVDERPFGPGCSGPGCIAGWPGGSGAGGFADAFGEAGGAGDGGLRTVTAGREVSRPVKLHDVQPVYPELARRSGVSGAVLITCTIAPDGRVVDARVASGPPLLSEAALAAVRRWRYRPTLLGGAPVSVVMTVTVHFRLAR